MLKIIPTGKFKKDLKLAKKRGYKLELLQNVILKLSMEEKLDVKYRDHNLEGDYKGCRECHIAPDWLLIYKKVDEELLLVLTRTGTHSDLF